MMILKLMMMMMMMIKPLKPQACIIWYRHSRLQEKAHCTGRYGKNNMKREDDLIMFIGQRRSEFTTLVTWFGNFQV